MRSRQVTLKILSVSIVLLLVALVACSIPGIPTPSPATGLPGTEIPTSMLLVSLTPDFILPAALPDLPVVINPSLIQINMLDLLNGWGTTETSLVRTMDGGGTWFDMTPPSVSSMGYSASVFFIHPDRGWLVFPDSDFSNGTMFGTIDGGANWSARAVPFPGGQIVFVDAAIGFILVGRGAAAGSSTVDVYSSTDGGTTWVPVYIMQPGVGDEVNSLPFSGQKSGISFVDSLHAWVGGNIPMEGYFYLYASSDGGHVWEKQDVSLPEGYETAMTEVGRAQFFSDSEGILPVRLMTENSGYVFYRTIDSGLTWIPTSALTSNGQFALASMEDIFVWDGGQVCK